MPDVVGDEPVLADPEELDGPPHEARHAEGVVAVGGPVGVPLPGQVQGHDPVGRGEGGHDPVPGPPGLRHAGQEYHRGCLRDATVDGVQRHTVDVDHVVGEAVEDVERHVDLAVSGRGHHALLPGSRA